MEKNTIIFDCIAAAAKVVFNHLIINPGNYTAADLVADCANIEADRQEMSLKNNHSYTNGRLAPEDKTTTESFNPRSHMGSDRTLFINLFYNELQHYLCEINKYNN